LSKAKKNKQGSQKPATISTDGKKPKANEPRRRAVSKPLLPGSWKMNLGIFLLLVLATVILYSGDLNLGYFAVDDPDYVSKNPWIKSITADNIGHILGNTYFANYSPVHLFSYMLDWAFAGDSAYAFHLSNNIWAGVVAGFVFLTALALSQNKFIAIAAGILFVAHPVHVEAVTWISSRKDLVATAFALPSFLAYLKWRRQQSRSWYIASVLLFLVAAAGKLSVATFPAVFLAHDFFVEKRPLARSILDKIPFLLAAIIIAWMAASAQPSMGHRPDPYVLSVALAQNFWLLSGFAEYVLYRMPPATAGMGMEIAAVIFLTGIFVIPVLLRKKLSYAAVLIYWILFGFIPAQVLSFTHPVTDRYVFFPSVAGVIGIAWILHYLLQKTGKQKPLIFAVIILIISALWAKNTLSYLDEWKDPRSVWFAAMNKSKDPVISQNLGTYYVDKARGIGSVQTDPSKNDLQRLAEVIWAGDQRLSQLTAEITSGQQNGPVQKQFKDQLFNMAWDALEKSVQSKGNRVMAALFYNRGLVLMEQNKLEEAKKEFLAVISEAGGETFAAGKAEVSVYSYYSLGSISLKQNNYPEALKWFRLAQDQQNRAGVVWMPTLPKTIKQLEDAIGAR
jgi:hypothetical protein